MTSRILVVALAVAAVLLTPSTAEAHGAVGACTGHKYDTDYTFNVTVTGGTTSNGKRWTVMGITVTFGSSDPDDTKSTENPAQSVPDRSNNFTAQLWQNGIMLQAYTSPDSIDFDTPFSTPPERVNAATWQTDRGKGGQLILHPLFDKRGKTPDPECNTPTGTVVRIKFDESFAGVCPTCIASG